MKDAIARLRCPSGTGTAWLCGRDLALTAAHCVEAWHVIATKPTAPLGVPYAADQIVLEFPWSKNAPVSVTQVVHFDLGLDAALLRLLPGAAPDSVQPITIAAPPKGRAAGAVLWSAYGFPRAHGEGLTLTGSITDVDGRVGQNPAMQLDCVQGGLGELNGSSGSAVCVDDAVAIGLIRYGALAHRVIFAASIESIAAAFPEVAQILAVAPARQIGVKRPALAPAAVAIWQKKRDYLQQQLAITADPDQKFALIHGIAEADQHLQGAASSAKALDIWKDKLRFFQEQIAISADAGQKFALQMQIDEAQQKIQELEG